MVERMFVESREKMQNNFVGMSMRWGSSGETRQETI